MRESRQVASVLRLLGVTLTAVLVGCGQEGGAMEGAVDSSFTRFTLMEFGGFGPSPPDGSTCDRQSNPTERTVVAATQEFSYSICQMTDSGPWTLKTNTSVLSSREFSRVAQALQQVMPSSAMTCGADAGVTTLDVETSAGVRRFVDDFYSGCPSEIHAGRTFATGLEELAQTLIIFQLK